MIGRQLRDRVSVRSTLTGSERPDDMDGIPAMVFTIDASNPMEPNRPGLLVTRLRAMLPGTLPRPVDPNNDRVTHDGREYRLDGEPMGRYRRGKIHHWTLNLERTTG